MKIKLIFDKEAKKGFKRGWGTAFILGDDFLFDTGEDFYILNYNFQRVNYNLDNINKIFITHSHLGHIQGLWQLLEKISPEKNLKVYIPSHLREELKQRIYQYKVEVVECKSIDLISEDIYTTGEFISRYKGNLLGEQALLVKTEQNSLLLCSCAHYGILKIIDKINVNFSYKVNYLIGGLHLMEEEKRTIEYIANQLKTKGIDRLALCCCAGFNAFKIFEKIYARDFSRLKAGEELIV